jgi:hypothetical protein
MGHPELGFVLSPPSRLASIPPWLTLGAGFATVSTTQRRLLQGNGTVVTRHLLQGNNGAVCGLGAFFNAAANRRE